VKCIAIDFETANSKRSSVCAIGLAIIEDGKIVKRISRLVKPPEPYFDPFNTYIHGITEQDVQGEPEFFQVWDDICHYFRDRFLIAHNASFDMSVLRSILDVYNIPYPTVSYFCTITIAKRIWPELMSHGLNSLSRHLGFKFKHHDAGEDATACANIMLQACVTVGARTVEELKEKIKITNGELYPGGYLSPSNVRRRHKIHRKKIM